MVALDVPQSVSTEPMVSRGTALYVERDASYVLVRRRLIGTMTRAEWDAPEHRQAAITAAWKAGIDAILVNGEEFVTHAPVALYRHPTTGQVVAADVTRLESPREVIAPTGGRMSDIPIPPLGLGWAVERTTYAKWAEGPLPHRDFDMAPSPTPTHDRTVQALRHQNRNLRDLIDTALGPAEYAGQAQDTPGISDLVDFRIRGVFRRRDYRVLVSKQDAEQGSKILTSDGIVE